MRGTQKSENNLGKEGQRWKTHVSQFQDELKAMVAVTVWVTRVNGTEWGVQRKTLTFTVKRFLARRPGDSVGREQANEAEPLPHTTHKN